MKKERIFIGKKDVSTNPLNDRHYQELFGLNPTLSGEIKKRVEGALFGDFNILTKPELNDNSGIISKEQIEIAKQELLTELEELAELTQEGKHIIVVVDECFTNTYLLLLLRKILGKEGYSKYVKVVNIDYQQIANDAYQEDKLSTNHSLIILGGSLSDTYTIDHSHYDSYLAKTIKQVGDEYHQRFLNKKILGVCFGQQYLANINGIVNRNSAGITATTRGPAQLSPSNCHFEHLEYINPLYQELLKGLSDNGNNDKFSTIFTRTGYVSFDLLNNGGGLAIVPLILDETSNGIVGWGSKNGNILGIQFHPELSFKNYKNNFKKHIKQIVPDISCNIDEHELYLANFEDIDFIGNDIGEAFYVFTLLGFIKNIKRTYNSLDNIFGDEDELIVEVSRDEATLRLLDTTSRRVDYIIDPAKNLSELELKTEWIKQIDKKHRLLLNYMLDWKVNRSLGEISEILGIKSITEFIKEHKQLQESANYIVRDLGAGDGNTIKELDEQLGDEDILIYGTGDYIYFDLYACVNNTEFKNRLPDELIILFVEKIIFEFKKIKSTSTIDKIKQAAENIEFRKDDKIYNSSMTGTDTYMFEGENITTLSPEVLAKFDDYLPIIEELKKYVIDNFYSLFGGLFQKIYISKFNDLHIQDEVISKIDFQFAIRSTSHIYGREYMNVIADYYYHTAKTGSIFIDNGIHQSYTSIPRLKELFLVSRDLVDSDFKLVYDRSTNYFNSVIITKNVEYDEEFLKKHLSDSCILVPIKEAYKATFFKLEYFVRNFIIGNFKNHIVFWDFNDDIIETLQKIMHELENKNIEVIPQIILDLINHIACNYKTGGVCYNEIELSILTNYNLDGETLNDLVSGEVYNPEWMNIDVKRKY